MFELAMAAALMRPATETEVRDRMIDLYEQACLQAFPNDEAVDKVMTGLGATALSKDQVRIYLHDDPGRGWRFTSTGTTFIVTVEAPPYHACAVRASLSEKPADLGRYPDMIAAFEKTRGAGFAPIAPYDADLGELHTRGVGDQRVNADRSAESFFYFVNTPLTQHARDLGAPGAEVRFVHQLAAPDAP